MKQKFKKLFYRWAYLDLAGTCKKEDTYFYRFSHQIGQSNLAMMRSMSIIILAISIFVFASTFTYLETIILRKVYAPIIILEIILLGLIQIIIHRKLSSKCCTILTSLHLFHMFVMSGYISVVICYDEPALVFIVILTISSITFTLPTMISASISTICTGAVIIASYYIKDVYWFESDMLNGICVLFFSFMVGYKINQIRADEAFIRADMLKLNEELEKTSSTDALTGLHNHRSFQDSYYEMFRRASALRLPIGVIMMDLDKFKDYNDNYGHVAGDVCLSRVANAIANSIPKGAIACRYGGEEFIVLLNEDICYGAKAIGEDIREAVVALQIPHTYAAIEMDVVTLSLGAYVGIPAEEQKPMDFVEQADKAMYQSKANGRNRLTVTLG